MEPDIFFLVIVQAVKSRYDALDGLPSVDRWGVIEAKSNISFQNQYL